MDMPPHPYSGRGAVTRALAVSKRQAQTLLRAAEAEKAIIEVEIKDGSPVFRLIPASRAQEQRPIDRPAHRGFLAEDGEEEFNAD